MLAWQEEADLGADVRVEFGMWDGLLDQRYDPLGLVGILGLIFFSFVAFASEHQVVAGAVFRFEVQWRSAAFQASSRHDGYSVSQDIGLEFIHSFTTTSSSR